MKKKTSLRLQDPYLQRETQRYEHPLPSREWITEMLEDRGVPLKTESLAILLDIAEHEMLFFERRLTAMARDGQILINRRGMVCAAEKLALVKCRVEAHKDGFGFAVPLTPDGQGDFVLPARQMRGLMHGDTVTVRPAGTDRRGRREGQVLDVIERAQKTVVGRLMIERGIAMLSPEDSRLPDSILLEPDSVGKVKPGQVVVAQIDAYPDAYRPAVASVVEVLGNYADSGMEIEIAVRQHYLPHQFSTACEKAAAKIPSAVCKTDLKGREDLRDLPLVTIDGESSRDFDDAVYAEKQGRNFRLVVAIADVSHYVKPKDAIDADALDRATSVYFPRRVIPMLPESLSNGICSLNPDVDRLCMVCDMVFTYAGNLKSYRFYPAVMRSHARLTYTQVWDWIENGSDNPLKPHIDTLYKLYQILLKKRRQRGAMEFETTETEMIFDKQGKIKRIVPVVRNEAHRLIEECMLAANVCAAEFLLKHQHPALFRNHAGPTPEKLATLREQLGLLGLTLGGGDKPTPLDYAALFAQTAERPDRELIQVMLLRSMQQAVYEPENSGHFGLAYPAYTHFTSPIRRYPDLLVHRAIKAVLSGSRYNPAENWSALGTHSSQCERRADEASRDVENWLKTYYMQDKVGEVFSGTVSGMAGFGLFVTLDDIHIEGLVHISELGEDYFNYRAETMSIEGERSGLRFSMGDKVVVQVARADLDTRKIDLILISGGSLPSKDKKPASKGKTTTTKGRASSPVSAGKPAAKSKAKAPAAPAKKTRSRKSSQPAQAAQPKAKRKPRTRKKSG